MKKKIFLSQKGYKIKFQLNIVFLGDYVFIESE